MTGIDENRNIILGCSGWVTIGWQAKVNMLILKKLFATALVTMVLVLITKKDS
ncbi:hypothetical protein [Desulfovibrio sp.]|uniref:hypothetical protein n=1 Tax=Desulfovibrio sp. TaxID=885 RepID=UPI0025C1339B|nr:hypothetical protein [Desulfovibrio sp.]